MKDDPYDPKNLELPPDLSVGSSKPHTAARKSKRLRPLAEPYIQLTETGARGFAIVGSPQALVWFEILYRIWKAKNYTIELPNGSLAEKGVSRQAKYRALERLEQAGWVQVERLPRRTVRVTVLNPGCLRPWR